jgi:hypothetical protein
MKKGSYYVPLFIILILNMVGSLFMENNFGFFGWTVALLLLCEIYYLRFLK